MLSQTDKIDTVPSGLTMTNTPDPESVDPPKPLNDRHRPFEEPKPNDSITNTCDQYAVQTFILAQLALQYLQRVNLHFNYFETEGYMFRQADTYLDPVLDDFPSPVKYHFKNDRLDDLPLIVKSLFKKRPLNISFMRKDRIKYHGVYKLLPSQPRSARWVVALIISYGAFYLSAWNAEFSAIIERRMWCGFGVAFVSIPIEALFISFLALVLQLLNIPLDRCLEALPVNRPW